MLKQIIKDYIWFWKESFSFMQGYNKLYIAWGCLLKAPKFCYDMHRHYAMTKKGLKYHQYVGYYTEED